MCSASSLLFRVLSPVLEAQVIECNPLLLLWGQSVNLFNRWIGYDTACSIGIFSCRRWDSWIQLSSLCFTGILIFQVIWRVIFLGHFLGLGPDCWVAPLGRCSGERGWGESSDSFLTHWLPLGHLTSEFWSPCRKSRVGKVCAAGVCRHYLHILNCGLIS